MNITVTGTPGTGKTSVSERLGDQLGLPVLSLNQILERKSIGTIDNEERVVEKSKISFDNLDISSDDEWILEGHLSHFLDSDICVVLRCEPKELKRRLKDRNYSSDKIKDNVESEALDTILLQAVEHQETVIEVENSQKPLRRTVEEIVRKIEKGESSYGSLDYSDYL